MNARALNNARVNQGVAADPANSVFVIANAGSGKTKVLVDRIARLLLQGSPPSAFLCITYTKAAAAEMQRRLFERLGAWCVADDEALSAQLIELGEPAHDLGRARKLFAQALETPGGLKIQTIHAFCERLLARFPLEAGVAPGFDIADEARAAAMLARARKAAALAEDAPMEAFRRFAAKLHGEALEGLLDRLALRRADFHRYAEKHQGFIFADAAIKNRHGVRGGAESFARTFVTERDWSKLRDAAALLDEGGKQDQATAERLRAVLASVERAAHAAALDACFAFALTEKGDLRSSFATATTKKQYPQLEPLLRRLAEDAALARDKWNAVQRAEDAAAALALALKLDQAYEDAKRASGALDFDDLIAAAHALLRRSEAAPWVLYKLDGGLDHILIDEGQDTSPAQWDLIAPLQDEFFSGRGARGTKRRTMFAVGDPKQSIYAFQGADPKRFLDESQLLLKRAQRAGAAFKAPLLETSFRSAPEILRAVDQTFKHRPLADVHAPRRDEIRHLAARDSEHGVVEVWPLIKRPPLEPPEPWDAPIDVETGASVQARLARLVAKRIKAMIEAREAVWDKGALRAVEPGDVLALVQTRGALFRELIKAFKRAGLPVAGADRMILREELAVEDCLALMRVALDPADDLSLACVLKGPWLNLDDDDLCLFPLAYGREKGESLQQRLRDSRDGQYANARAFVNDLVIRAGADPFSFLSWALETAHFGGPSGWELVFARLGMETRDPLEELLQRSLKPQLHAAPTLQRFLSDIELDAGQVKRELEAETGAIRVMTVHGAKGLEAPVVILPDSTRAANTKPDDNLIFDDNGPYFSQRESDDDTAGRAARAAYKQRMLGEHWRLLYVAMTRSRDRLIVCGTQHGASKDGEAPESWRLAVEQALTALGAERFSTPTGEGLRLGAPLHSEPRVRVEPASHGLAPWARLLAPEAKAIAFATPSRIGRGEAAVFSPRARGGRRFRRGLMIHSLLQHLPELTREERESVGLAWLARQGVNQAEASLLIEEALKVIDDSRFAPLFAPNSRSEQPIIGDVEGVRVRGIVDRLAIDNERVMILDYKTDRPTPENADGAPDDYVLQLALYRSVLRKIFPGRAVMCALLWTEKPQLMELPDARLDAALHALEHG